MMAFIKAETIEDQADKLRRSDANTVSARLLRSRLAYDRVDGGSRVVLHANSLPAKVIVA
jgi:hypothetical protein